MSQPDPVPVYIEFGDHDAIEQELDRQMGIAPKPRRDRAWECLAGEAPQVCQHNNLSKDHQEGRVVFTCQCGHSWFEVHG